MPNDVNRFTSISVTNLSRRSSNCPNSAPYALTCFGASRTRVECPLWPVCMSLQGILISRLSMPTMPLCCPSRLLQSIRGSMQRKKVSRCEAFFSLSIAIDPSRILHQLKIDVAHHFEQQPFSLKPVFCDHCGSFVRPGHVHKCVRMWKQLQIFLLEPFRSDCGMFAHRRCISKVGNYCGCEDNVLALYEKWKETVSSTPIKFIWLVS